VSPLRDRAARHRRRPAGDLPPGGHAALRHPELAQAGRTTPGVLVAQGFAPADALAVYRAVASYARGYALAEATGFTVDFAQPSGREPLSALHPTSSRPWPAAPRNSLRSTPTAGMSAACAPCSTGCRTPTEMRTSSGPGHPARAVPRAGDADATPSAAIGTETKRRSPRAGRALQVAMGTIVAASAAPYAYNDLDRELRRDPDALARHATRRRRLCLPRWRANWLWLDGTPRPGRFYPGGAPRGCPRPRARGSDARARCRRGRRRCRASRKDRELGGLAAGGLRQPRPSTSSAPASSSCSSPADATGSRRGRAADGDRSTPSARCCRLPTSVRPPGRGRGTSDDATNSRPPSTVWSRCAWRRRMHRPRGAARGPSSCR
jgi:hypothetical protein